MLTWLFDPANASDVSAIAFLVGVISFVFTIVGLLLTFLQARKAVSVAKAVKTATANFQFRVTQYDSARDISEASYALDITRRHLNNGAWKDAIDSYEDARRAIVRIEIGVTDVPANITASLKDMNKQMRLFCNKVDSALSGKSDFPDTSKVHALIRRNYETIASVQKILHEGRLHG